MSLIRFVLLQSCRLNSFDVWIPVSRLALFYQNLYSHRQSVFSPVRQCVLNKKGVLFSAEKNKGTETIFMDLILSIALSLVFIWFMVLVFIGLSRYLKIGKVKLTLIVILFVMGFTLYYIGYYEEERYIITSARAFLSTAQMFVLNNNLEAFQNPWIVESSWALPTLSIISVLIFSLFAQTIAVTVFKDFSTLVTAKYSRSERTFVFMGYDPLLDTLIEEIQQMPQEKVYVVDDGTKKTQIVENGYAFLPMSKLKHTFFRNAKSLYFLCLTNDLHQNLMHAKRIFAAPTRKTSWYQTRQRHAVHLYVRINDHDVKHQFPFVKNTSEDTGNAALTVHFIHEHDLYIKRHVNLNSVLKRLKKDSENFTVTEPFQAWIGGFYPLGDAFFKYFVQTMQFVGQKPVFHLSDARPLLKSKLYQAYPDIDDAANITIVKVEPESDTYVSALLEQVEHTHVMLFAFPDEALNIDFSLMVDRYAKKHQLRCPKIYCYLQHAETEHYMQSLHANKKDITFFGSLQAHFTHDFVLNDRIDQEARHYHQAYQETKRQKDPNYQMKNYDEETLWDKASNRAVAEHDKVKLFLLGLSKQQILSTYSSKKLLVDYIQKINKNGLDILGETEHMRWNAFHYVNGWTHLSLKEALQLKKRKCLDTKRHVCLVDYDALDEVAEAVKVLNAGNYKDPFKQYDIDNFILLPEIIMNLPKSSALNE